MNNFNNLFETQDYWSTYENGPYKEIGFFVSDQHFITTGGIGQFAKAFYDMCTTFHCRVHFILDKPPSKDFYKYFTKAVLHYPDDVIPYTIHQDNYFRTDTYNMYKQANFHSALIKAKQYLDNKSFDIIICNTHESLMPAYSNGCKDIIFYTHLQKHIHVNASKGKFSQEFHNLTHVLSMLPDITIGTQSLYNAKFLRQHYKNVEVLPIPMPDQNFLKAYTGDKHGVLYVGRYEAPSRPERFLEICKEANVPVKIMTSRKSAEKFKDKCVALGLEHEIRHSLFGQEKLDYMLSSRLMLNVSKKDSFCIAALECIGHMPVIVQDDQQEWTPFFDKRYMITCKKKDIVRQVSTYYESTYTKEFFPKTWYGNGSLDYVQRHHNEAYDIWNDYINRDRIELA